MYTYRYRHHVTPKFKDTLPSTYSLPILIHAEIKGREEGEPIPIPIPPLLPIPSNPKKGRRRRKESRFHQQTTTLFIIFFFFFSSFSFFPAVCRRTIWLPTMLSYRYASSADDMGRPVLSEPSRS